MSKQDLNLLLTMMYRFDLSITIIFDLIKLDLQESRTRWFFVQNPVLRFDISVRKGIS